MTCRLPGDIKDLCKSDLDSKSKLRTLAGLEPGPLVCEASTLQQRYAGISYADSKTMCDVNYVKIIMTRYFRLVTATESNSSCYHECMIRNRVW